ncbi:MAG: nuclear transport factor 2 family protein [Paracoccaceae bacterium]
MDGATQTDIDAVTAAAETYCHAVYKAQQDVFETLCHDAFHMVGVDGPELQTWDKAAYLARVTARDAAEGDTKYKILTVEADGDMARVKLLVGVPGTVYEDYLGFVRVGGEWKLMNKLFRTADSSALAG